MIQLVSYDTQIMSNGIFKSPVHRVVTNSERERISVAVFSSPDSDKEIEPIGKLFNDSRPRLYKKVKNYVDTYFQYSRPRLYKKVKNYVDTYFQYYQQRKRPIDAVRYEFLYLCLLCIVLVKIRSSI